MHIHDLELSEIGKCVRFSLDRLDVNRSGESRKILVAMVHKQNMERWEESKNIHTRRELFSFLKLCQLCYLVCYCSESHRKIWHYVSCFKLHLTSSYQLYCLGHPDTCRYLSDSSWQVQNSSGSWFHRKRNKRYHWFWKTFPSKAETYITGDLIYMRNRVLELSVEQL